MEYNSENTQQREFTWLDYTILKNPNGVMTVLAKYGYIGYLAPQDTDELFEASQMLINKYEDKAVIDLLRVHPDYEVIKETPNEGYVSEGEIFKNFTENNTSTEPKRRIDYTKALLLIGGLFVVAALIK